VELDNHPTVLRYNERKASATPPRTSLKLSARELRTICLEAGVDDVGFAKITHPSLGDQKAAILRVFPWTKTLVSFVGRINRENLRSPARSIASLELHQVEKRLINAAGTLASALEHKGIRAATPAPGFPMEADRWGNGAMHVVSHKPIAVAAGLGKMGLHRNVIHPIFGSFVLLNTVLIDAEVDEYNAPLDYNPCLDCKLCAAACPTGAIAPDGFFNPVNCLTHTYRELIGGFSDWVENIVDSKSASDYRTRTSDAETISMWQSLTCEPGYKSVYCMAVCPAGDQVIPQFMEDRKAFIKDVVKPLQQKTETVYVLPGSDAESHVVRTFPHKKVKRVRNGIRPQSVANFLASMPIAFQRHQSEGLNATYHFTFSGNEEIEATVVLKDKSIRVEMGHAGVPDVRVHADAKTWLRVLHRETSMLKEIVLRRIRVKGPLQLFKAFGKCFA
jgi:Fe-S-cluster-containing hydrogenase component 2